jgi:hypothetical protein
VLLALSYLWFTRLPADGHFWSDLLVPYVASGFGLACVFIPLSLAALTVVEDRISGISSGLLNASQQIGGALGVAIIATVSTTHTESLVADRVPLAEALTQGYQRAFWLPVGFAALGVALTAAILRSRDVPTSAIAAAPGPAA